MYYLVTHSTSSSAVITAIQFNADEDYRLFLDNLSDAAKKHPCDIHAYVLMTNHIHLLATPHTENGICKMMQMLGRYYVQYYNHTNKRTGTLWEGRYKASLIDSETYALLCYRYDAFKKTSQIV